MNRATTPPVDGRGLACLQLLRLPNVSTAWADVAMGYLLATAGHGPWQTGALLLACSSCLYLAGMVLNDVCDFAQDVLQRPQRPLPSGRVTRRFATGLGVGLTLSGLAAGWCASVAEQSWHSGIIATSLAICVVLYDVGVKRTVLGPLLMGACRALNVVLGMSAAAWYPLPWHLPRLWLGTAAAIGTYVAGITWFARHEAGISRRGQLLGALAVMAGGIVLLMLCPMLVADEAGAALRWQDPWIWPTLLVLLTMPVWRRAGTAIVGLDSVQIQATVKTAIMTLILLDAAVCLAFVGLIEALAVVSLLMPFLLLGQWIYST